MNVLEKPLSLQLNPIKERLLQKKEIRHTKKRTNRSCPIITTTAERQPLKRSSALIKNLYQFKQNNYESQIFKIIN